ncbi:MAG: ArsR/SmtB family transcription factor [Haloferacaceae archaeon]
MADTLPLRPSIDHTPRSRLVLDFADEEATTALDALACETARDVVAALADGPATASDLADAVGTSLQNVQYHLAALREAGLVVDAGTWYSSRGAEMTVYAAGAERIEFRVTAPDEASESDPSDPRESADRDPLDDAPIAE